MPGGFTASDDADGTLLRIGALSVRVHRVLEPVADPVVGARPRPGEVTATWNAAGDTRVRGVFVTVSPSPGSS